MNIKCFLCKHCINLVWQEKDEYGYFGQQSQFICNYNKEFENRYKNHDYQCSIYLLMKDYDINKKRDGCLKFENNHCFAHKYTWKHSDRLLYKVQKNEKDIFC